MNESAGRLQREILQSKPFPSRRQEAVLGLLKTADLLRREIGKVLAPQGVTNQQYNVLRIRRGAGPEGLPTLEVARRMIEDAPGITRFMDRLEGQGLLRRERDSKDRRQVFCFITEKGLELLESLDEPVTRWNEKSLEKLSEEEVGELISLLDRARER